MTKDEVIALAREAGLVRTGDKWTEPARWGVSEIERFAALVAAHERSRMCKQFNLNEELAHETATKDASRD